MRKSEGQRIPEKEIANFQFIKLNNTYITETDRSSVSVIIMPLSVLQVHLRSGEGLYISLFHFQTVRCPLADAGKRRNLLWNFSTVQSRYCRLSSSHSVLVSASGERSTCWRATATITPVPMLMCDKVTPQYDRQPPLLFRTKGHSIRRVHDFMLYLKY